MPFLHRKLLHKSMEKFLEQPCTTISDHYNDCNDLPPLPAKLLPPPPPQLSNNSLSPFLIVMFCGLAVSFSFICYLTLSSIYRRRQTNRENRDVTHDDFINEDRGSVIHHPIWLINTIGLDQSQIESIRVFKYKKEEGLNSDCSVCLSEFEDDESLRLLPKCSHAFHVSCIDTWLRSHKNCPLCRALVFKNDHETIETNLIEANTREETQGGDSENIDHHHVVAVENNGEVLTKSTRSGARVQSDLADRHRVQKQEFVALRRSVSMGESLGSIVHDQLAAVNVRQGRHSSSSSQLVESKMASNKSKSGHKSRGSSSSMSIHRVMKSSSLRKSLRKASSFTKRSSASSGKSSHNRSY